MSGKIEPYSRVIPRDLFNESNLLFLLGKLVCHIEDRRDSLPWRIEYDGKAFDICQDENDGSINCFNISFFIGDYELIVSRPLNCREKWTLIGLYKGEEYYIFDSNGNVMPNFGYVKTKRKL